MIQEPSKGDLWELKSKKVPGGVCPGPVPLEARLGNQSVFILDPRLQSASCLKSNHYLDSGCLT